MPIKKAIRQLRAGDIDTIGTVISDNIDPTNTVTVDSATFEVFDSDDASIQASGSATIGDNISTTVDVYGLVNTTAAAGDTSWDDQGSYYVKFTIVIGSLTKIVIEPFEYLS